MNKLISEILYMGGLTMITVCVLIRDLKIDTWADNLLMVNGIYFVIRSFIIDYKEKE